MGGMSLGTLTAILAAVDQISPVVNKMSGNIGKAMGGIKGAIGGAFTVGAVTAMVGKLVDVSGRLTDMSAKTQIGTTALQKLEMAFGANGVKIETVTASIGEMGRRIVSGDSGALNALTQLGLKAADLVQMEPDKAFEKVADAVARIENPMERATAAQEVFGKQGRELLAGLDGHLAETTAQYERMGLVLSEDVIAAGDEFGDVLGVLEATGMAFIAQVVGPLLPGLTAIAEAMGSLAQNAIPWLQRQFDSLLAADLRLIQGYYDLRAALAFTEEGAEKFRQKSREMADQITMFTTVIPKAEEPTKRLAAVVGVYGEHAQKAAAGSQAAAEKAARLAEDQERAAQAFRDSVSVIGITTSGYLNIAVAVEDSRVEIDEIRQSMEAMNGIVANTNWVPFAQGMDDAKVSAKGLGAALKTNLLGVLQSIPGTLASALQGGGGVGGALKSIASQLGSTLGGSIGFSVGGPLGQSIGSAIGSFAGPLASKLGNLFGKGAGKAANDLRDQIISQAGGFDTLAKKAAEAGTSIDALLRARDTKGVQAAADALNAAINGRAEQIAMAKAAMEEFGISADKAGLAFKQAEMDETAKSITEKLEAMMSVGVSTDAIIEGAGDEIGAFIQRAIEMGTTVPKEWEPIVSKMIAAGTLIDANGEKFTDMSQVPFAETLNDKIGAVMDKLAAFLDGINKIPDALGRIPRNIDVEFNGRWNENRPEGFAGGSHGIRDFGAGTPVILHGRERVQTEAQMRAEQAGRGTGGGNDRALVAEIRDAIDHLRMTMPLAIRDAVMMARA